MPSQHVALHAPGESADCAHPVLRRWDSPSSIALWTRHSQCPTLIRFRWNPLSGSPDSLIRYNLLRLLASLGGPDQAFYSAQPTEAFTSELSAESVALLAVGYIYGGIWAPPPTGLSPVGTAASFAARTLRFKVSEKGGISVYGLGRFPVTLYVEQWERLRRI